MFVMDWYILLSFSDTENNDVHLEQGDTQEQCKQNEGLQFNVSPNEHMIMTGKQLRRVRIYLNAS